MTGTAVPDPEHARRHSRGRRHADRAGLSHGPLGGRLARAGGGRVIEAAGGVPFAAYGAPTRATAARRAPPGMMDSLPYRNDAAIVFRRLIRSLPTRQGVLGVATCDKGLPAMMLALAGIEALAVRARARRRDIAAHARAKTPARSNRSAPATLTASCRLHEAAELGCRACASPAAAASSWAPRPRRRSSPRRWACRCRTRRWPRRGQPIWLDMARRIAPALLAHLRAAGVNARAIFSPMPRSATPWSSTRPSAARPTCCCTSRPSPSPPACGGRRSTTGTRQRPGAAAGRRAAQRTRSAIRPCASSSPAACPRSCSTCERLGLLDLDVLTVAGVLARARCSTGGRQRAPQRLRDVVAKRDGVDPDDVIM